MEVSFIAEQIKGKVKGNPELFIEEVTTPENANQNSLVIVFDQKTAKRLSSKRLGCVVGREDIIKGLSFESAILIQDPKIAMIQILNLFKPKGPERRGISPLSHISPKAKIEEGVVVSPFCVIEEGAVIERGSLLHPFVHIGIKAKIGKNVVLYPFVTVSERCEIKDRVTVFSGAVIGADGFGFFEKSDGYERIPQIGKVVIEEDCEIGANTTIDRATIGETRVKKGTKVDNLVQIAHNCEIGEHTVIAAQTGLAGSVKVGSKVKMGGQVGISDHITIGDGVALTAKAGVAKNVPSGKVYSGYFAREHKDVIKAFSLLYILPRHWNKIKKLLK